MESYVEVGARVWLAEDDGWIPATVSEVNAGQVTFTSDYGKPYSHHQNALTRQLVTPMHSTSVAGVEDMAKLGDLHEAAILHNLWKRYKDDKIYTHIGSILVALNPYKTIDGLYEDSVISSYNNKHLGDMPPHIYAVANEAYYSMWRKGGNQCVLISGESGAGKTESTKLILRYLSSMSQSCSSNAVESGRVEHAIIQSSPILEAFGNAKTVYNNNSSRFGKFIKLNFKDEGNIEGGEIVDYLLEKNRVVNQNPAERNFHIFYCLLSGANDQMKGDLCLSEPSHFNYLNKSGCTSDPTIDDRADFKHVLDAMLVIGLTNEQIKDVLQVLAAILHVGNITFIPSQGAQVSDTNVLENASNLLQVDMYQFSDALTQKSMTLRGEEIFSPLTVEQATFSRDSVAMALYTACFKWLIKRINERLSGSETFASVGLLDIFGFENFKVNRFEQFNINFANEKLQEYFNKHIFSLEQLEYNREGLEWTDIDWNDNGECLDLVERKLGILSLIDEESNFPKGTDESMLSKLHDNHAANPFYIKPRVAGAKFGIRHYAGEVFYTTTGFLEKNRDTFRDDLLNTIKESRSDFVYDLFEHVRPFTASDKQPRGKGGKKPTVSSQFKSSLFSLMTTLNSASPYFVRCIKPNSKKTERLFEPELVLSQLKYSGMLETVKIRKAGFPVRRTIDDFIARFLVVLYKQPQMPNAKDNCISILKLHDAKVEFHRIGITKIFLKDQLEVTLEIHRQKNMATVAKIINNTVFSYLVRKRYLATRRAIMFIQKMYKAYYYRKLYLKKRKAAILIQRNERGRAARQLYHHLLEEKRIEEERKREEQRLKEEEEMREMERLQQEQKTNELEELKRKVEEEARLKREAEEENRRKDEDERQEIFRALEEQKRLDEETRRMVEEAQQLEEEERLRKEEEALRLQAEEEERNQLEELERLDKEATESALAEMEELDEQLKLEDYKDLDDDDLDEEGDESYIDDSSTLDLPTYESYLQLRGGIMNSYKRHWCVLKDDTLMWFRGKQKALKAGWLTKKGGGMTTLSRRNWKKRWFVLKDTILSYHESDQDGAKTLGSMDLRTCKSVMDSGQKENAFSVVMPDRTYHIIADNPQDWSEWFTVLNRVHRATDDELREMKEESANIRNAVGTIDTVVIDSISRDIATKPECFNIITANRVYSFIADSVSEAKSWQQAIESSKEKQQEEGITIAIEKGWLTKMGVIEGMKPKARWFILTSNSLDFYKSADKNTVKLGSIILTNLCTVVPPPSPDDPKCKENSQWEFIVNGRKRSYTLVSQSHSDAVRWTTAIQEVIDGKTPVDTPFSKLVGKLMNTNSEQLISRIYRIHPLLSTTKLPLKLPLLPLPYGNCQAQRARGKGYGSYYEEALRIFTSIQEMENVADPIAVTQGILQTCQDMKPLRDEVYCQLVKQITGVEDVDGLTCLRYMQVLVCMTCTFLPSRKYLRYLRFHIKRLRDKNPGTETAKFVTFALENLRRTRAREFPPSRDEIITLLGRRDINATVYCYGGGSCKININSSTTAGEVVKTLCKGIGVENNIHCTFALFEQCGLLEKSIEDRVILADILAKFERYKALKQGKGRWRLFFKIFCFLDPSEVSEDSVEGMFLFEQTCENVVRSKFPLPETTLYKLGGLRLQHTEGDFKSGSWIPDKEIASVYPVAPKSKNLDTKNSKTKPPGTVKGTWRKAISPFNKSESEEKPASGPEIDPAEELSAVKSSICDQWRKLQGMSSEDAQTEYMQLIQAWPVFGSTVFQVKQTKYPTLPDEVLLAVSYKRVSLFKSGDSRPIEDYLYEDILSFGAPQPNTYRIIIEGRDPITFYTDEVIEIAKLMKAYINEIVKHVRRKSQALRDSLHLTGDEHYEGIPKPPSPIP